MHWPDERDLHTLSIADPQLLGWLVRKPCYVSSRRTSSAVEGCPIGSCAAYRQRLYLISPLVDYVGHLRVLRQLDQSTSSSGILQFMYTGSMATPASESCCSTETQTLECMQHSWPDFSLPATYYCRGHPGHWCMCSAICGLEVMRPVLSVLATLTLDNANHRHAYQCERFQTSYANFSFQMHAKHVTAMDAQTKVTTLTQLIVNLIYAKPQAFLSRISRARSMGVL